MCVSYRSKGKKMNAREDTWAVDVKSIFTLIKFHAKSRNFIPYSRRINRGEPTIIPPPYSPSTEPRRLIFLRFVRTRKIVICHFPRSLSLSLSSPTLDNTDRASSWPEINFYTCLFVRDPSSSRHDRSNFSYNATASSSTHARCNNAGGRN